MKKNQPKKETKHSFRSDPDVTELISDSMLVLGKKKSTLLNDALREYLPTLINKQAGKTAVELKKFTAKHAARMQIDPNLENSN